MIHSLKHMDVQRSSFLFHNVSLVSSMEIYIYPNLFELLKGWNLLGGDGECMDHFWKRHMGLAEFFFSQDQDLVYCSDATAKIQAISSYSLTRVNLV